MLTLPRREPQIVTDFITMDKAENEKRTAKEKKGKKLKCHRSLRNNYNAGALIVSSAFLNPVTTTDPQLEQCYKNGTQSSCFATA